MTSLPPSLSPEGLGRAQAAEFCGISSNTFNTFVENGQLPQPIRFGRRKVWTVDTLRAALKVLTDINAKDKVHRGGWADVGKDAIRR